MISMGSERNHNEKVAAHMTGENPARRDNEKNRWCSQKYPENNKTEHVRGPTKLTDERRKKKTHITAGKKRKVNK